MILFETLNSWSCCTDHPSFLIHVKGPAWEDGWVWHGQSSACYPAHPESLPDISAVCYNSSLSLKCPLHCGFMGLLENGLTDVFLSACPRSRNHLSYIVLRTLPKCFFFQGVKALGCQWRSCDKANPNILLQMSSRFDLVEIPTDFTEPFEIWHQDISTLQSAVKAATELNPIE